MKELGRAFIFIRIHSINVAREVRFEISVKRRRRRRRTLRVFRGRDKRRTESSSDRIPP
jgi:hypothetical protein